MATVTVTAQTGIETLSSLGVKIWVANGELRIENYESSGIDNISIYNTAGQLILNSINISNWTSGVCLVKIGRYVEKIVKK